MRRKKTNLFNSQGCETFQASQTQKKVKVLFLCKNIKMQKSHSVEQKMKGYFFLKKCVSWTVKLQINQRSQRPFVSGTVSLQNPATKE